MIKTYIVEGNKFFEVYVSERDRNKKLMARRKRGIVSERVAKQIEVKLRNELRDVVEQKPRWTWGQWHEEFLNRIRLQFKNSTIQNYEGYLKKWIPPMWAATPLNEITLGHICELLDKSSVRLGKISQKNILKMLRRIFEAAIEEGILKHNPTVGFKIKIPQVVQKVLNPKEVEILLRMAEETSHRFYPVWAFALTTGMRSGEMQALKWTDIDLDSRIISVSRQWTSKDGVHELKTGDWRVVPVSEDLRKLLVKLKIGCGSSDFVLPRLQEWARGEQAKVLRDFCESMNITSVKFHDLRATFITNLLSQGVSLVKVMAIVGHKKMETTDIYLRLAGVDVKGATESLGYKLPILEPRSNVIGLGYRLPK